MNLREPSPRFHPMKSHFHPVLTTVLAALLFAGCYQVPVTGRRALSIVDDKEVTKMSIAAMQAVALRA